MTDHMDQQSSKVYVPRAFIGSHKLRGNWCSKKIIQMKQNFQKYDFPNSYITCANIASQYKAKNCFVILMIF